MLTHIRLQGFKSFVDQSVAMGRRVVCVGPNASGKSNLFDALCFLKGLASGLSIAETLEGHREGGHLTWPGVRGGFEVRRADCSDLTITTGWTLDGQQLDHEITCRFSPEPHIVRECVSGQRFAEVRAIELPDQTSSGVAEVSIPHDAGGRSIERVADTTRSHLARPQAAWDIDPELAAVFQAMRAISPVDVRPDLMRGFVSLSARDLGSNAENLSAVLHLLARDPEKRAAIVDWLRSLCAPELEDLGFIEVQEVNQVMLKLVERGGTAISARSLSDGTLHFLGMLVAIYTAPASSLLLLEDLDAGLHPSRLRSLVQAFERAGDPGAEQVMVTTHSPYVLAALERESLRDSILFNRSLLGNGSLIRRLGDLPDFDEVEERLGIVRMFETEWLEQAL